MVCSVFDLFKIGVGPSSSHTMGPMTAACRFVEGLRADGLLERTARVEVDLYGSLALTGKGHATDRAILLGLSGERPDRIDPDAAERTVASDPRDGAAQPRRHATTIDFDEAARPALPPARAAAPPFERHALHRARRRRRRAGAPHLLFGRRRRGGRRGGGGAQRPARRRLGRAATATARPTSCSRIAAREGIEHRRHRPRQRARRALRRRDRRPARRDHRGDVGLHRPRHRGGRHPARRAQRQAPRAGALPAAHRARRAGAAGPADGDRLGQSLGARGQRGECGRRQGRHRADQRRRRHRPGGAALLSALHARARPTRASAPSCSPPRRSARCSRRMPRSRAPRSAARARSASPARWRRRG